MNLPRIGSTAREYLDRAAAGEVILWRHVPAHLKVRLWAWSRTEAPLDRRMLRLPADTVFRIERSRQRRG